MRIYILFFLIFFSKNTFPNEILIDKYKIVFDSNNSMKKDVNIYNISNKKSFIEVVVEEAYLEKNNIKYREFDMNEDNLITTPKKLILQPKESLNSNKKVTFISLNENVKKEKIYRASFYPRFVQKKNKNKNENKKIKLNFFIVYETYIYIKPNKIKIDYSIKRKKRELEFTNNGNSSVLIKDVKYCKEKCYKTENRRVISGGKINLEIPEGVKGEFILDFENGILKKEYVE